MDLFHRILDLDVEKGLADLRCRQGRIADNAVRFARKDKMDLAIGVTVGTSIQVALVVAPILVFAGYFMGQDMNLLFTRFEMWAVVLAVVITRTLIYDGESTWLEGLMLIAIYLMLGFGFFHLPPAAANEF